MNPLDVQAYKGLSLCIVREVAPEISDNVKRYNRYNDILPTPSTRVCLKQHGDNPETTYINANYVPFGGKDKAYIAAMGPLTTTIGRCVRLSLTCHSSLLLTWLYCCCSFVRMMWEENVVVCVMTTNFIEKGKKKFER